MPLPKKILRSFVRDFKDDFKGLSLSLSETKTREIAIQLRLGALNDKQGTSGSHIYADSMIQSSESTSSVDSSPINIGSPVNIGLQPTNAGELLLFLFHCVSLIYSRYYFSSSSRGTPRGFCHIDFPHVPVPSHRCLQRWRCRFMRCSKRWQI